jgi:protein-disulfide isomerase
MRSLLFEKQQAFGSVPWSDFARQAGIPDTQQFDACMSDTRPFERIDRGKELAEKMNIRGTPTLLVNGWKLPVPPSPEELDKIVRNVLEGRSPMADVHFVVAKAPTS